MWLSCAPRTCDDTEERQLTQAVDVLVSESGSLADEARQLIAGRGRAAIAVLETGLYNADSAGRKRVIQTLVDIADPEVVPILKQLARVDTAEEVREAARRGLAELGHSSVDPPPQN